MSLISIGIVDDKAVNREVIVDKIRQCSRLTLSLIAESGMDCLQQLQSLPASGWPAVIFMDLEMPGLSGIETIAAARDLYPSIFFIVLTVFDDDDKLFEAIRAGAHGYLLKDETAAGLEKSVITVLESGGAPMSPAIARKTLGLFNKASFDTKTETSENAVIAGLLSDREKEVLKHTINGLDAKKTAEVLGLSVFTVRKHIANIYLKLHVTNKGQAIQIAYKHGLL